MFVSRRGRPAVGSIAGQIAKLKGASLVVGGSAGTDEKVRWQREIGFDAAFDYKAGPAYQQLREVAPKGIDVYFDNVGGEQLEAALTALRLHGRVALCGAIANYNVPVDELPAGPRNIGFAITKRLALRGFLVNDHIYRMADMIADLTGWLRDGKLQHAETVVDGLEHAPDAFLSLLRGGNSTARWSSGCSSRRALSPVSRPCHHFPCRISRQKPQLLASKGDRARKVVTGPGQGVAGRAWPEVLLGLLLTYGAAVISEVGDARSGGHGAWDQPRRTAEATARGGGRRTRNQRVRVRARLLSGLPWKWVQRMAATSRMAQFIVSAPSQSRPVTRTGPAPRSTSR